MSLVLKMPGDLFLFSIFYLLICLGIIYPTTEFVSSGLTINNIFSNQLGSENEHFIQYHLKRTTLTLFVHSTLPTIFVFLLLLFFDNTTWVSNLIFTPDLSLYSFLVKATLVCPLLVLYQIYRWSEKNWTKHPICKNLLKFRPDSNTNWMFIAADINIEFRRVDKMCIQTNPVVKVIATDNWIIKITPYNLNFAHQSDSALIVSSSDTHNLTHFNQGEIQFINIEVKSTRPFVEPFFIRLNALDFKDLQDKYARPITILPNVTFHKTLMDRFIEAFREQVSQNQKFQTNQELEMCIGCMQTISNVKLQKVCLDDVQSNHNGDNCANCYCKPMWCIDCMARWFASRQDEQNPDSWLANKCTCPVCRAKFCVFDVLLINNNNE